MTTTIKKLSKLNVAAINETMLTGVATTATTAIFDGTPAEAIKLVGQAIDSLGGGNAHPRGSLFAVVRKLEAVAGADGVAEAKALTAPTADEFPTMAITPEEFADALLADMLNLDTPEETTVTTSETVTLPDGIAETPALRPVYAAMINGATTTREMVDATGIILAKVRVALNTLKAAGVAVASDQIQPGKPVTWSLVGADEAQADEPEAGWNSTIAPGGDDDTQPADSDADDTDDDEADDTPAATVDAPQAPRTAPKRVRLLAAYPNDPAPSTGGGKGKQMGPILEFLKANPGVEYTVREVQNALSLPDYPSAAHERLAADPSTGVSRVDHGNRKKFVYNPAAQ